MDGGKKKSEISGRQVTVPEAVKALLSFMNDQLRFNRGVRHDMKIVEELLVKPRVKCMNRDFNTCISAIK